jgi:transcriptional regulator with XRE-family HTH domain
VAEQPALTFAELLRQLRTDAGLTQEELADKASLSTRTISELERGKHKTAQKATARALANALANALHLTESWIDLFVAAARGRVPPAEVLAARQGDPPGEIPSRSRHRARRRLGLIAVLLALVAVGALTGFALRGRPANPPDKNTGNIYCGGDVCAQVESISSGTATIKTWANDENFYGHFEMITPEGQAYNSSGNQVWPAGGPGYYLFHVPKANNYTARGWRNDYGDHYTQIGQVSFLD